MASLGASAQITENFDDITLLAGNGWSLQNLSSPVGSTNWFQGTNVAASGPFDSYNGAANSYIGANYNNTGSTGTISNWLITPSVTLRNGDVFTFYSRKAAPDSYADRLEVRMSTNGTSTNAGSTATSVGDFTTLLLSINPNLVLGVYPTTWTQYTITISGLPAPTPGRLAFRYFVTSAGLNGTNSDYIGIDAFQYTPYVCPGLTVTPSSLPNGTAGSTYGQSLGQTGALGAPSFAVTAGALPPGVTLSASGSFSGAPTATGTFNFTVTVADASGCSGSQAYSITVVCPTNGATLSSFPSLCDNGTPYTLIEGSPAGGTYSGTGVSGNQFDPSVGTQTITYTLVDPYGCTQMSSNVIAVNTAPTVTVASFAAVCDNAGMITLGGESPAGGTWSGTGVSGNQFDPMNGTQTIMYSYTDANGCNNSASQTMTVNAAPMVTVSPFIPVCDNAGMITLGGASPAGGTWSGTGVSGNQFDPMSGTQSITYAYTDANGCSNSASQTQTVNAAPTVTISSFSPVCSNSGVLQLTGEAPAGGTWSGTGVTGSMFDPAAGTQVITYDYTDANGCSSSASQTQTVNAAPTVTASIGVSTICSTDAPYTLPAGTPAGGTWSGTGVSGGVFSPATAGLGAFNLTYTYTDNNSCTASATDMITVSPCTGIEEAVAVNGIGVYPNPTNGQFTIEYAANGNGPLVVSIYDVNGKVVSRDQRSSFSGEYRQSVDLSTMPKGVYVIEIENNGQRAHSKIVLQ